MQLPLNMGLPNLMSSACRLSWPDYSTQPPVHSWGHVEAGLITPGLDQYPQPPNTPHPWLLCQGILRGSL